MTLAMDFGGARRLPIPDVQDVILTDSFHLVALEMGTAETAALVRTSGGPKPGHSPAFGRRKEALWLSVALPDEAATTVWQ